jgi:hypothetical protein
MTKIINIPCRNPNKNPSKNGCIAPGGMFEWRCPLEDVELVHKDAVLDNSNKSVSERSFRSRNGIYQESIDETLRMLSNADRADSYKIRCPYCGYENKVWLKSISGQGIPNDRHDFCAETPMLSVFLDHYKINIVPVLDKEIHDILDKKISEQIYEQTQEKWMDRNSMPKSKQGSK